jgi:hypothetical protein
MPCLSLPLPPSRQGIDQPTCLNPRIGYNNEIRQRQESRNPLACDDDQAYDLGVLK